jgi:serine/threonine protein kinase
MREVYRARDLHLDRVVAIKVLRGRAAGDPESPSLAHPRICLIRSFTLKFSFPVLVMEYLEGDTLDSCLESGPMPLAAMFDDKMAFMLSEQSGGIWVADLPRNIQ